MAIDNLCGGNMSISRLIKWSIEEQLLCLLEWIIFSLCCMVISSARCDYFDMNHVEGVYFHNPSIIITIWKIMCNNERGNVKLDKNDG